MLVRHNSHDNERQQAFICNSSVCEPLEWSGYSAISAALPFALICFWGSVPTASGSTTLKHITFESR